MDVTKLDLGGWHRELIECFEFLDETYRQAAETLSGRDHVEVNYEQDLAADPVIGYRKLLDHVGFDLSQAPHSRPADQLSPREGNPV